MTEAERYAKELIEEQIILFQSFGKEISIHMIKNITKDCIRRIIVALEEYDTRTETYLKKEFGQNYTSAELQNMEQDFRFYDKVLTAIDKL